MRISQNTLSVPLHPLGVAPGVVVLGEGGGDPIPPALEGLHAEELRCYLVLQLGKQEEVAGGQVQTVRGGGWSIISILSLVAI